MCRPSVNAARRGACRHVAEPITVVVVNHRTAGVTRRIFIRVIILSIDKMCTRHVCVLVYNYVQNFSHQVMYVGHHLPSKLIFERHSTSVYFVYHILYDHFVQASIILSSLRSGLFVLRTYYYLIYLNENLMPRSHNFHLKSYKYLYVKYYRFVQK